MPVNPMSKAFRTWSPLTRRCYAFRQSPTQHRHLNISIAMQSHGDLNNSHAARARVDFAPDPAFSGRSFAISKDADEPDIRRRYRPFLLDEADESSDWVAQLELSTALKMVESEIISRGQPRLRILVLYGSIRNRSVSPFYRFCTLEPHLTAAQGVCVGACKSEASVLAIATNTNTHTAHFPAYYPTSALESCSVLAAMSACTTLRACHKRMMCSTRIPKYRNSESSASGATATSGLAPSSTEIW